MYVLFRIPCVYCEIINESINSDYFWEVPNTNTLVVVVLFNLIEKSFQ